MFFKLEKWWVYKIAGGLLTAVLFTVFYHMPITNAYWRDLTLLFAGFISLAVFGHLVNDLSDLQSDRLAGKSNLVDTVGKNAAFVVLFGTSGLAFFFISLLGSPLLLGLASVQILLNLMYSVRPIRVKERGGWAILITGFYERTLPYIMIAVLLVKHGPTEIYLLLPAYLTWSFLWEVRNFITGQKADRLLDLQSQQNTVSLVISDNVLNSVHWGLFLLEAFLLFLWIIQFPNWWIVFIFCIIIGFYFHWRENGTCQIKQSELFKVVDDTYNLSFPVLFALLALCTYSVDIWPIFVLLLVGFDNHIRLLFVAFVKNIDWQRWWRWVTFPFRSVSLIFNWFIYYFRKWILKWPEERNWGRHYAKHLEEERVRKFLEENNC